MTRDEVVAHILERWAETASLAQILRDLARQLETSHDDEQEDELDRTRSAVPTPEELFQLLRAPDDQRDVVMMRLLWAAGLRSGELRALRAGDHDHTVGTLFVRGGKGDKDRYVLLDPVTNRLLKAWTWNQPPEQLLFPLGSHALRLVVIKWARKIGLLQKYAAVGLRFSPHSFRHSFATHLYQGGMQPESVRFLLGHEDMETTLLYVHGDIRVWRERFLQALVRDASTPQPPSHGKGPPESGPYRREVVAWILATVPPEGRLEEVVTALGQLRLGTMPSDERELVDALSGEIRFPDVVLGSRLPLMLSPDWIERLSCASGAPVLVRFLCGSGVLPAELPEVTDFDFKTGIAKVGARHVVVDPGTAHSVREHPEALAIEPEAAEALLWEGARKIGLAARYEGLGRTFTSNSLRCFFASRLCEGGMDLVALHNLLGHRSWATTQALALASPGRFRAEYLKCHPLASA